MSKPVEIFIAYSRKDAPLLEKFRVHLKTLERLGKVKIWDDGKIEPGAVWEEAIKEHLHGSDIILLLVSADAIASDYFYEKEMADALERHRQGKARVVPMIMRHCPWEATPLAELQALPQNGKPVISWPNRDKAYADAANALLDMVNNIEELRHQQAKQARLQKEAEENERLENERRQHEAAELQQRTEQEHRQREAEARSAALTRRNTYLETVARAHTMQQTARWAEARNAWQQAFDLYEPGFPESRSALQDYITECETELARLDEQKEKQAAEQKKRAADAADKKEKEAEAARRREAEDALQKKNAAIAEQTRKEAEAAKRKRQDSLGHLFKMAGMTLSAVLGIFILYKIASGGGSDPGQKVEPIADLSTTPQILEADMAFITGGTYDMGCTSEQKDCDSDESPVTRVTVNDFYIGKYEVTFEEYDAFCDATGRTKPSDQGWGRGKRPVINVSWLDAAAYCNWLSEKEKLTKVYTISGDNVSANWNANGYRLPTEAEWEYAARGGGKKVRFGNGKDIADPAVINFDASASYKKPYSIPGEYRQKTVPVGSLNSPNALGLHDMSGNVWEWCWDWKAAYPGGSKDNYRGPDSGSYRVRRGGSWLNDPQVVRVADRSNSAPGDRNDYIGFRLARTP